MDMKLDFEDRKVWLLSELCKFLKQLNLLILVCNSWAILPFSGKRKQVTYHLNQSYWCFHILPCVLFYQAKFYASTLILLRDMLGRYQWKLHILLFYMKCHFCHLLPFAKEGQYSGSPSMWSLVSHDFVKCLITKQVIYIIHTEVLAVAFIYDGLHCAL